jgi:hypothetical protein
MAIANTLTSNDMSRLHHRGVWFDRIASPLAPQVVTERPPVVTVAVHDDDVIGAAVSYLSGRVLAADRARWCR